MSIQLRGLAAWVRPYAEYAYRLANYYGIRPVTLSVYRGWSEQERLYRDYLAGKRTFPANAPGDSSHNFGLGWDSWVPPEQQSDWTAIREYIGFRVPSNDLPHAEVPGWRDLI